MAIVNSTIVAEGGILTLPPHDVEVLVNTTQALFLATDSPSDGALLPADLITTLVYLRSMASIAENTNLVATGEFSITVLFSIMDNLLMPRHDPAWRAADTEHYSAAVTLLNATEKLASIVANTLGPGEVFNFSSNNLVIEARSIANNFSGAEQFDGGAAANVTVTIPGSIVRGENGASLVVVAFFNRLANFLPRVYANKSSLENNTNPSAIVSIQVNGVDDLSEALAKSPIHLQFEGIIGTPECAFWNYSGHENATYVIGGWSLAGVTTHHSEVSMVVNCSSRHLTSFAVLVKFNAAGTNIENPSVSLTYGILSYIGCAVSLLCLIVTIPFLLVTMRKMKRERDYKAMLSNFVLCNLCIALACGLLVFLAGIEGAKSHPAACKTVAFLLHYFFLAAFFWMLCEAVMMYNLLVKVFHANERKWAWFYLALGWGPPLPIVVITIASRHEPYIIADTNGNPTACWLSSVHGTIFAFIGPMLLILLVNGVLLTFVMRSLCKFYRDSRRRQFKADKAGNEAKFLSWKLFKSFIIILPLLGFTWVFGVLAVDKDTLAFAMVFIIFNSLQGTAIFFCFVVRSDQVWPKIVSLCKFCFLHRPSKSTTADQLPPPHVPASDSAMNNWALGVATSDNIPRTTVLTTNQLVVLTSPSTAAQSTSSGVADVATDLSSADVLW